MGSGTLKRPYPYSLKTADIVNIALVTFKAVLKIYTFGTPSETLLEAANYLYAYGGTDMYSAVMESINMFEIRRGGQLHHPAVGW